MRSTCFRVALFVLLWVACGAVAYCLMRAQFIANVGRWQQRDRVAYVGLAAFGPLALAAAGVMYLLEACEQQAGEAPAGW